MSFGAPLSPSSAHANDASSLNSTLASLRTAIEAEIARNPAGIRHLIPFAEWLLQRITDISHGRNGPEFPYPHFDASVQLSADEPIVPATTVTFDSPCYDLFQVRPDLYQMILDINSRMATLRHPEAQNG
jgi:hypothetical protein